MAVKSDKSDESSKQAAVAGMIPATAADIRGCASLQAGLAQVQHVGRTPYLNRLDVCGRITTETLEHLLQNPLRRRAVVKVDDAASFCAYLNRFAGVATRSQQAVFAEIGESGAVFTGVLDYHDIDQPGGAMASESGAEVDGALADFGKANWGKHRVVYAPKPTPEWVRWTGASGVKMTQGDFAEFLEDNGADVNPNYSDSDPNGAPTMADMVEMSRNLSATTSGDFSQTLRLQNGQVQFRWSETVTGSTQTTSGMIEVPERFLIGIAPFVGFDGFEIWCRLKYRINSGRLTIWFEMERPHKVVERACKQVVEKITAETGLVPFRGELVSMGL